jgi:hypothetical protein
VLGVLTNNRSMPSESAARTTFDCSYNSVSSEWISIGTDGRIRLGREPSLLMLLRYARAADMLVDSLIDNQADFKN